MSAKLDIVVEPFFPLATLVFHGDRDLNGGFAATSLAGFSVKLNEVGPAVKAKTLRDDPESPLGANPLALLKAGAVGPLVKQIAFQGVFIVNIN